VRHVHQRGDPRLNPDADNDEIRPTAQEQRQEEHQGQPADRERVDYG
jgi:hypothetical protein